MAVELPLNDVAKRKAILEMTGFNVDSAIMINDATKEEEKSDEHNGRRVNNTKESKTEAPSGRRTAVPNNNVKIINK